MTSETAVGWHESDEGVFGLKEVVGDFDPADLDRLREVAAAVRTRPREGVTAAMALAGSAAQSAFQPFPGDCDFFERVAIAAPTREAALRTLVGSMIETVAHVFTHRDLQFAEMKLGLHPRDATRGGEMFRAGSPVSWSLGDLDARSMTLQDADGNALLIDLHEVASDPGFVKLDWVYADPHQDRVVAVTKVIDATWEAPGGSVIPLDGVVDSFYQEIYLEPASRAFVERLVDQVSPAGLGEYVAQLQSEIEKYSRPDKPNFGKVAKRLYNVFRVTKRHEEAAYVRGLFDDPAARLYQVSSVLNALNPVLGRRRLDPEVVDTQLERFREAMQDCYSGSDRDELIGAVSKLDEMEKAEREGVVARIKAGVDAQVSGYFEGKLRGHPTVGDYLAVMGGRA